MTERRILIENRIAELQGRMDRRKFLLGVAGASAAFVGADTARIAAAPPTERARAIASELLIVGFSGSDARSPSAQALAAQIRDGSVGGWSSSRTTSATRMTSWD